MIRALAIILGLCLSFGASAQTYLPLTGVGGAYVGPADIVSGAKVWAGLRAYSSALANAGATTTKVADVRGTSTATSCTIFLLGNGTGNVDLTTSGAGGIGNQCASGATTFCTSTNPSCAVSKLYDQSGNGFDLSQTTAAQQPILTFNCLGSLPCLTFSNPNATVLATGSVITQAQPYTFAAAYNDTNTIALPAAVVAGVLIPSASDNAGINSQGFGSTFGANQLNCYSGNVPAMEPATNGIWHAGAFTASDPNSVCDVEGTTHAAGATGTLAPSSNSFELGGDTSFGQNLTGTMVEGGLWPGSFTSGNVSSMSSNQHSYWGF